MAFISSNAVDPRTLNFGGGIVYLFNTPLASKASADTTPWENIGFIGKDNSAAFDFMRSKLQWKNGTPSKVVYEIPIDEAVKFNAPVGECDIDILTLVFGVEPIHTISSTISKTILGTPTPTVNSFTLSDSTDIATGKLYQIDLDPGGNNDYHYRRVKTLNGAAVTIPLDLPSAPEADDTFKAVEKTEWDIGGSSSFIYRAFKYEKLYPIINYKLSIVLYKVGMSESVTMTNQDDNQNVIPLNFEAVSDNNVESGKFGFARLEPTT